MLEQLKYHDGTLADIERLPDDIKGRYGTAFDIDPKWLIECASRRQKWLDMGQSLNLYIGKASGRKLHEMYTSAWSKGLKTTYYLRSLSKTNVEKSTVDINKFGVQPKWMKNQSASASITVERTDQPASQVPPENESQPVRQAEAQACDVNNPDCEACQ